MQMLTLAAFSHRLSTGDSGQPSCTAHYIASKMFAKCSLPKRAAFAVGCGKNSRLPGVARASAKCYTGHWHNS